MISNARHIEARYTTLTAETLSLICLNVDLKETMLLKNIVSLKLNTTMLGSDIRRFIVNTIYVLFQPQLFFQQKT